MLLLPLLKKGKGKRESEEEYAHWEKEKKEEGGSGVNILCKVKIRQKNKWNESLCTRTSGRSCAELGGLRERVSESWL